MVVKELIGVMRMFQTGLLVTVAQLGRVTEKSLNLMNKHLKWLNCMVCKLYLNPGFEK